MACNGTAIPHTPIAVDFWCVRRAPSAKVFFLSHMHADHTAGLTPTWSGGPIYCSPVSKKLLIHKFKLPASMIHELEVNECHVLPLDAGGEVTMTVSLIDANHCPGAVMFLFQGYFGNILYTGDFRYSPDMLVDSPISSPPPIDGLYLDNTYCTPNSEFPSRADAKRMISKVIRENRGKDVVIGVRNLGKEDMLEGLAVEFKTRIVVSQTMYDNLEVLEAKDVFTTDPGEGFIFAEPFNKINGNFIRSFNPRKEVRCKELVREKGKWIEMTRVIGILPTALYVGLEGTPHCNHPFIHIVPFSDHSSYSELHEFVRTVKPKRIYPIVPGSAKGVFHISLEDRACMKCFESHLSREPMTQYVVPSTVKKFMESQCSAHVSHVSHVKRKVPPRPTCRQRKTAPKEIEYTDSPVKDTPQDELLPSRRNTESDDDGHSVTAKPKDSADNEQKPKDIKHGNQPVSENRVEGCNTVIIDDSYVEEKWSTDNVNIQCKQKRRKLPLTFVSEKNKITPKIVTIKDFFPRINKSVNIQEGCSGIVLHSASLNCNKYSKMLSEKGINLSDSGQELFMDCCSTPESPNDDDKNSSEIFEDSLQSQAGCAEAAGDSDAGASVEVSDEDAGRGVEVRDSDRASVVKVVSREEDMDPEDSLVIVEDNREPAYVVLSSSGESESEEVGENVEHTTDLHNHGLMDSAMLELILPIINSEVEYRLKKSENNTLLPKAQRSKVKLSVKKPKSSQFSQYSVQK